MTKSKPDSKIIEKIRKCLKLGRNAGATEDEAAAALRAAHNLMRKHNLEMSDVDFEEQKKDGPKKARTTMRNYMAQWEMSLGRVCDVLFEVHHHIDIDYDPTSWTEKKSGILFIGLGCDAAIAKEAYGILRRIVQKAGSSRGHKGSALREYCEGFVNTLNKRAWKMMEDSKKTQAKTKAMVVAKSAIIDEYVKETFSLETMKTRGATGEAGTWSQGADDGKDVNIKFRDTLDNEK